tara:strand:+ start:17611 stop:17796 length:186 start_codon:yes stop_codon:yes gene_type:complete
MKYMDFKEMVIDYIFNDETKEKVIAKWNKDINIPFLNEKTERKIFESIWESVESVLKGVLK